MSIFAQDPIESIQGNLAPLGRDQQNIKVYFTDLGEVLNAGQQPQYTSFQAQLTNEDAWTTDEIDTVISALSGIEEIIDVGFVLTTDQADADLDFAKNDDSSGSTGYTVSYTTGAGASEVRQVSVVLNHTISSDLLWRSPWSGGYEIGTYGYQTLLTMLGLSLGLGFPHSDGQGTKILEGLSPSEPFSFGPDNLNDSINSVMAQGIGYAFYDTVNFQSGARGTMGAWDIAALQALYGATSSNNSGDDVYQLVENFVDLSASSYFKTIYDTGGSDWIKADFFDDAQIDLRPATLNYDPVTSGGPVSFTLGAGDALNQDGFTIAAGTIIENAEGALGDDTLIGNDVANVLLGRAGQDLIFPGLGADTMDGGPGRDEYAGTVAELNGDVIGSIEGLDRIFVYGVSYTDADLGVVSQGGQTRLIADTGQPGERLEMVLDPAIGLAPSQYRLFSQPREEDTLIVFAQADDFADDLSTQTSFIAKDSSSFQNSSGIEYGVIETAGDADYFDLYDVINTEILIEVIAQSAGGGTLMTPTLELYDDTGALLASDSGTGPGGVARLIVPADEGGSLLDGPKDHFFAVRGASGEVGTYTIRGILADDVRNDIPGYSDLLLGRVYELTPSTTPLTAELESAGDKDLFYVRMAAGVDYQFDATGLANYQGARTNTKITIYDDAGTSVAANNNGGPGTDARLIYTPTQQGNYFVEVSAGTTAATGAMGQYDLTYMPADDYADVSLVAALVEVGGTPIEGAIETGTDADWFAVWLEAGEAYTFQGTVPSSGGAMEIFTDDFISVGRTSVSFWGETVSYTPTVDGIHYVWFGSNYGVSVNNYTVSISGPSSGNGTPRVGTNGDDSLAGGGVADRISALDGDDTVGGLGGADTVFGGPGADSLLGDAGPDIAAGGSGADRIFGGGGNDYLLGDGGDDYLNGGNNLDTIYGGRGEDTLVGEIGQDLLSGGSEDDLILGGNAPDTLLGGSGNDTLNGQGEADLLRGDAGADLLSGGASADTIEGGAGNDTMAGGAFNDLMSGDDGADVMTGGSGLDTLSGGAGADLLDGGSNADYLDGGVGQDTLLGGIGRDELAGGSGEDNLDGGAANDTLDGGGGADFVVGGTGSDLFLVNPGEGGDTLSGGPGLDRFDFKSGFETSTITDFTDQDVIDLIDVTTATDFSDLVIAYGTDATIDMGGGDTLVLQGITGGLAASDFVF